MNSEPLLPPICERCGTRLDSHLFCFNCESPQHFHNSTDYFQAFGLRNNFQIDQEFLDKQFLRLTEELHPDLFMSGTKDFQNLSESALALINRALETLSEPFARAEYLLSQKSKVFKWDEKPLDPEFLKEMFTLQEKLDEFLEQQNTSALEQLRKDIEQRLTELESVLYLTFKQLESTENSSEVLQIIQMNVNTEHYLKRLLNRCKNEDKT